MEYEIVATLGPASTTVDMWRAMWKAGVSGFRLNSSHLSAEEVFSQVNLLLDTFNGLPKTPYIVIDLQGSKWRLGKLQKYLLEEESLITLKLGITAAERNVLPVPHADFFMAAEESDGFVVLNDANSVLKIESINGSVISARVIKGGEITSNKGITMRDTKYRVENPNAKDLLIYQRTRNIPEIRYAISYIKDAEEMHRYRDWFGSKQHLIAKIERSEALEDINEIDQLCNEMWICRGDLGAEIGLNRLAFAVQTVTKNLRQFTHPVLMAGQVLEHMTAFDIPTRSEVCHLLDLLTAGYKGFVLSDETAIGKYPLDACEAAAMFRGK